jgi:hypothetical protein
MTPIELAETLTTLYDSIGPLPNSDPGEIKMEIDYCNAWLAQSAQLVAEAQAMYDKERGEAAEALAGRDDLSASAQRLVIDGRSSEKKRLLVLADRLNATLTHRISSALTLLSFAKQEMMQTRMGGGT